VLTIQLLNGPSPKAWSAHIMGAARLIQLRGPEAIKTEYDKALLISLSGPIVRNPQIPPYQ
jgi:hypothetical protein